MNINLILPYFISSILEENEEIELKAKNFDELYKVLQKKHFKCAHYIFDENQKIKNNIIVIVNDTIINKNNYESCLFENNSRIEILSQFAGG